MNKVTMLITVDVLKSYMRTQIHTDESKIKQFSEELEAYLDPKKVELDQVLVLSTDVEDYDERRDPYWVVGRIVEHGFYKSMLMSIPESVQDSKNVIIEDSDVILETSSFTSAHMHSLKFKNCRFINVDFAWNLVSNCEFWQCRFYDVPKEIKSCEFNQCAFERIDTKMVVKIDNTEFYDCYFPLKCQADKVYLSNTSFRYCKGRLVGKKSTTENDVSYHGGRDEFDPSLYVRSYFHKVSHGYIGFKSFCEAHKPFGNPSSWEINHGSVIEEVCDSDVNKECSYGISFGSFEYMRKTYITNGCMDIHAILIRNEDIFGVCVPYNTDGKLRTSRLQILNKVEIKSDYAGSYLDVVIPNGRIKTLRFDSLDRPSGFKK